ncbi:MAG: hypothetical protein J0L84_19745 [Verrucomicrobia bacterium]|nr:hypothetical protein [Verrucomicrobiota bacterium]
MLTLSSKSGPRSAGRSTHEGVAVVWLHGLVAVACGTSGKSWAAPEPAQDATALGEALLQAMAALKPGRRTVTMAVAHLRLRHQHLDLPPLRANSRQRYLERQVSRIPGLEGPQCWSFRTAVPITTPEAVLLSLLPRSIHDQLAQACTRAGLVLQHLIPLSDLLLSSPGPADRQDPGHGFRLIATPVAGRIEMAVSGPGGRAVLARSSGSGPADSQGDGGLEVLRTAQFLQQTYAKAIEIFQWLGPGPGPALPAAVRRVDDTWTTRAWAEQLLTLDPRAAVNLVSRDQREAAGRRVIQASHRVLAMLGALGAGGFLVFADQLARHHTSNQRLLQAQVDRQAEREEQLRQEILRVGERQQMAEFITSSRPPMPLWLLAGLTEVVPRSCQVTEFEARWDAGRWRHRITGRSRDGSGIPADRIAAMSVHLAQAPFCSRLEGPGLPSREPGSPTNWTHQIRNLVATPETGPSTFLMEGTVE